MERPLQFQTSTMRRMNLFATHICSSSSREQACEASMLATTRLHQHPLLFSCGATENETKFCICTGSSGPSLIRPGLAAGPAVQRGPRRSPRSGRGLLEQQVSQDRQSPLCAWPGLGEGVRVPWQQAASRPQPRWASRRKFHSLVFHGKGVDREGSCDDLVLV